MVRLLGPFEMSVGGRPVEVTGRLRTLLAVLSMSAGQLVSVDRLATGLWGEARPADTRRSVRTYVTRLRAAVGAATIVTRPAGYVLDVTPEHVDALRFVELLDALESQLLEPQAERARLMDALALWRGAPFEGVRSEWLAQSSAPLLLERYLTALERRVDLDLAGGRFEELVEELADLTAHHPLRESLWVRRLVALHSAGRQAEALRCHEMIRLRIAEELGSDPGPELQKVHADLLGGHRFLPACSAGTALRSARLVPRQLPGDNAAFVGRDDHLTALHAALSGSRTGGSAAGPILLVHGAAGVGKTTLVVHWAHQVRDHFPDGQLYVNLRGYGPVGSTMEPAEALPVFLNALGVPPEQIPDDLAAQLARYRSLLAARRMLVVLDNARDAELVRALLPGSGDCVVVVTSRSQLPGLVTANGAQPVHVGLLSPGEAREMLTRRLGEDRLAAEPEAVDKAIQLCARLPLALAIVAARAATQPAFSVAVLTGQLREAGGSLDAFTSNDPATDVRTVFSWSYQTLTPDAAWLFRLLGLHPGPDVAGPAAASLGGIPLDRARALLAELVRAHLIAEHVAGRFALHDLVRTYACELAGTRPLDAERQPAVRRMLDHYLHTAHAAAELLGHRDRITLPALQPGTTPEEFTDQEQALAWFHAEHEVLVALIEQSVARGQHPQVWRLARTINGFSDRQRH